MQIKLFLVPPQKYPLKCPHEMAPVGICVHNTANDASAKNEITYMVNNANQTSFHLAVDDIEAWQGIPFNRNGWHAGDGVNGEGNRKYIAIEICYSKSGGEKFDKAEDNAVELIAKLLKDRNWGIEHVKKHQDFSGKYCPHRTLDLGWERFLAKVKKQIGEPTMANMYGTPNQYDLTNIESMKVAVDELNKVLSGYYIKKTDAEKLLNEQKESYEKRLLALDDNRLGLATLLKLSPDANYEQIFFRVNELLQEAIPEEGQIGSGSNTVPENTVVNGRPWTLNGLTIESSGVMVGNYKRND